MLDCLIFLFIFQNKSQVIFRFSRENKLVLVFIKLAHRSKYLTMRFFFLFYENNFIFIYPARKDQMFIQKGFFVFQLKQSIWLNIRLYFFMFYNN